MSLSPEAEDERCRGAGAGRRRPRTQKQGRPAMDLAVSGGAAWRSRAAWGDSKQRRASSRRGWMEPAFPGDSDGAATYRSGGVVVLD